MCEYFLLLVFPVLMPSALLFPRTKASWPQSHMELTAYYQVITGQHGAVRIN